MNQKKIDSGEYVPNAPIRELVLRNLASGELPSWSDLAVSMGMSKYASTTVKRILGIVPNHGVDYCVEWIRYDHAASIVRYFDCWPMDYGI